MNPGINNTKYDIYCPLLEISLSDLKSEIEDTIVKVPMQERLYQYNLTTIKRTSFNGFGVTPANGRIGRK